MGRNYELNRIEEDIWEKTPEKIQLKRRKYSQLRDDIIDSNKKIKDFQNRIKKLKDEKKEWEKEKIELYHQLVTFQENSIPSISPTSQEGKNNQWSINFSYGGVKRKKYLGSDKKVREKLDEIKNTDVFVPRYKNKIDDLNEECGNEVKKVIEKNLMNEMRTEEEQVNILKKWKKDELNMWDYLK
tara:strand:- start:2514 stop:3068 length:555 start_codon:yes stop_codon:yes gene_type:complete